MKLLLNKILSKFFGYQIKKNKWLYSSDQNLIKSINYNSIKTIIDIGANEGQFAERMINLGFNNTIISFEPMTKQYDRLVKNAQKTKFRDINWIVEKKCAIGSKKDCKEIFISGKNQSSSLMNLSKKHIEISPEFNVVENENVEVETLDNFKDKILSYEKNYLLKIDVQGFELEVLKGSSQILNFINCIFIEVSHENLYQNQPKSIDVINFLIEKNFSIWSIDHVFINRKTGKHYQSDIFLVKH